MRNRPYSALKIVNENCEDGSPEPSDRAATYPDGSGEPSSQFYSHYFRNSRSCAFAFQASAHPETHANVGPAGRPTASSSFSTITARTPGRASLRLTTFSEQSLMRVMAHPMTHEKVGPAGRPAASSSYSSFVARAPDRAPLRLCLFSEQRLELTKGEFYDDCWLHRLGHNG